MQNPAMLRILPFLAIAAVHADTIELKDGTKYEGTLIKKDATDYYFSIQVTKSIKDERKIPKDQVLRIVAEEKDLTAFEELSKLLPVPDLSTVEDYDKRLKAGADFIKQFPDSKKKAEVLKIIDTLDKERTVIFSGGVKFEGRMISAAERNPKAYALDASIAAAKVKRFGDAGDYLSALRAWTKFEKDYLGSSAYIDTVPYTVKLMRSYQAVVNESLSTLDARVKQRQTGLSRMADRDRTRSQAAIDEELAAYKSRLDAEKAAGIKWMSLDPFVKAPLDDTKRSLDTEIKRLENLQIASLPKTEAAYQEAWAAVTKEGSTKSEIESALSKVRSSQLPAAYQEILTKSAVAPTEPAPQQ